MVVDCGRQAPLSLVYDVPRKNLPNQIHAEDIELEAAGDTDVLSVLLKNLHTTLLGDHTYILATIGYAML